MARLKWFCEKWQQRNDCLDSVPQDDTLLILDDANACVGVYDENARV